MHHPITVLRHPLYNNQFPLSDSGSGRSSSDTSSRLCVGDRRRLTTGSRSKAQPLPHLDRQGLAGRELAQSRWQTNILSGG